MTIRHSRASGNPYIYLLIALLLAPLALVDVPPLLDYPNHLARAVVLAFPTDAFLSRMYAAHWAIIPNLGTDLLLPPLIHLLPVYIAGRIVIGLAILLPFLGTIAYSRALFGERSLWPLAASLVVFNATLLLGFLNFLLALGLALLLAAAWITGRERAPAATILLATFGSVVLFFCHLMGVVFFFVLIAGHELQFLWRHRVHPLACITRIALGLPLLIPPALLYAASPLSTVAGETQRSTLHDKLWELVFPFANYLLPLDVITAALVVAFLILCVATRHCRVTFAGGFALAITVVLYAVLPFATKGTYFLETRCIILTGFLLFGALLPVQLPRAAASISIALFTALFAVRLAVVALAWHAHQRDIDDMRAVIAPVEPGARVFVAYVSPEEAPQYWQQAPLARRLSYRLRLDDHLPALLLIERRAYWPFLFDDPSQQPVMTLPPYRDLGEWIQTLPDHLWLQTRNIDLCGYDDLLLMDAGGEPDLADYLPNRLSLLTHADIAALYRINPTACASSHVP
jgi:hypothetical protein